MVSALFLVPPLAQCSFFGPYNGLYYSKNRWVYFQEKGNLCNNFIQKKGDGRIFEDGPIFDRLLYFIAKLTS